MTQWSDIVAFYPFVYDGARAIGGNRGTMADTSLWPVVVGGLLALGGTVAGAIATTIRDAVQQRHETRKRRADKFEELVAAVYEFDHWLEGIRNRDAFGHYNVPASQGPRRPEIRVRPSSGITSSAAGTSYPIWRNQSRRPRWSLSTSSGASGLQ
jgi:hypothetical protein